MKRILLPSLVLLALMIAPASTVKADTFCGAIGGYCGIWGGGSEYFVSPTSRPSFQVVFDKENTYDSQNSRYYVCPNSQLSLKNIASYIYTCENAYTRNTISPLVAWVYNGNNKLALAYNNIGPDSSLNRSDLIPGGSRGACKHYASPIKNSLNVYTYTDPSIDYKTYVDFVNAYCDLTYNLYICPYNSPWTKACWPYSGWVPQKQFDVKVLGTPKLGIAPPQPVTANPGAVASLRWTITNTGTEKEDVYIAKDCGGWNCNFVGYTENSRITLNPGQTYNLFMNLSAPVSGACAVSAGITVTYDDGYGFSCIQPATMQSYIPASLRGGCAGSTTTTTTTTLNLATTSTSTTSTTLIVFTRSVTLWYNVTGGSSKYNCTVWTNISGSWIMGLPVQVLNSQRNHVLFSGLHGGMYGWTVNCSDGASPGVFAFNGIHGSPFAPFAPEKIRIFYVNVPAATTTTTTTTTTAGSTTTTTTLRWADLFISDIWPVGSTIYYNLENLGGTGAAASKSSLTIDGSFIREDNDAAIAAGVTRQESFSFVWTCSGLSDIVRVCADSGHVVPESDETNNCRNETWACPMTTTTTTTTSTLPSIIQGNSDVVLITDLSGTMMYCLNGGHSGCSSTDDTCPNTPPHANGCTAVGGTNPVRYDYAQKLNRDFVDRVLGRPNNKVALLAFGESAGTTPPFRVGLSSDASYLKTQINQYIPGSAALGTGTGTCVAIRAARKILEDQSSSARNKYIILLSYGVANTRCTGTYPALTHYQPREHCCSTSCSGKGDYVSECPGYDLIGSASCNCAYVTGGYKFACFSKYDTVSMANSKTDACDAKTNLGSNMWIYTIGMFNPGFAASCYWGKTNLDDISACGGGQTFIGTTPSELENIYNKF
jgi:hypothetical protein